MRVCLIQPCVDPTALPVDWTPVGLGFIATALRNAGHDPFILDYNKDYRKNEELGRIFSERQPDVVGFTSYTRNVKHVADLARIARKTCPKAVIVVGGPHASTLPKRVVLDVPDADFAIAGEGEIPLVQLLDGVPKEHIPGLIYLNEDLDMVCHPAYFHPNVEDYGIPAWDLIKPRRYDLACDKRGYLLPFFTSRGCPYRCSFCAAKSTSGPKWRRRSMDLIFREMSLLRDIYGCHRFVSYDEGFGSSKATMMQFCNEVHKRSFTDCRFECGTGMRLDQIDEEMLTALKKAGFRKLIPFGIESGSERILKLMHKESNLQLIREKITLIDKMGFHPSAFCILGYPSETRDEMEATIRMTLDLPFRQASFMTFLPLPGTEATRQLIESGELPEDFDYASIGNGAIVYAPKGMTTSELQNVRRKAIIRFFWRPRIIFGMMTSWREIRSLFVRFWRIYFQDRAK